MADPPILDYTTTITAERSVGEVQTLLDRAGATTVAVTYHGGRPTAVQFVLDTPGAFGGRYTLPVRVDAVHRALIRYKAATRYTTREHAERVAWRIAKDWLEVQLALVRADMAELAQVMLPYQHTDDGRTVWETVRERQLALPSGGGPDR